MQLKQSILNRSFGWKSSSWSKRRYPLKSQLWKINLNGSKSYFLACTLGVESFRRMMELIGYLFLLIIFSINSMIYMICIKWILKIFDTIIIHIILNDKIALVELTNGENYLLWKSSFVLILKIWQRQSKTSNCIIKNILVCNFTKNKDKIEK